MSGWTQVAYGRRRGGRGDQASRFQRPSNQGRGRGDWGKDSAFPVPQQWGTRGPFPPPNRPVPPPVPARPRYQNRGYRGPQPRSYADVVKSIPQIVESVMRGMQTQKAPAVQPRVASDPQFGLMVRKLYKVLKLVHHLQNVAQKSGNPEPRMISRMVSTLADMIKPAAPNAKTKELIEGNAKNWGYTTIVILENHYEAALQDTLENLGDELTSDWEQPFEVATKWAQRNLPRIKQEVIDQAKALIVACEKDLRDSVRMVVEDGGDDVPPPPPPAPPQDPPRAPTPRPPQTQPQGGRTSTPAPTTQTQQQGGGSRSQAQPATTSTPVQPTTSRAQDLLDFVDVSPSPIQTEAAQDPGPQTPKEQRLTGQRVRQLNACVITENDGSLLIRQEGELDNTPPLVPTRAVPVPAPVSRSTDLRMVQVHHDQSPQFDLLEEESSLEMGTSQDASGASQGSTSSPPVPRSSVKRHMNTTRKMVNWTLSAGKKWVMIGDSNLSRLPSFQIPDLQIDSYPGANFRHAGAILSKATVLTGVEKLILSFGINCRSQKIRETAMKQVQTAFREARKRFPYAEIWIPQVNFSSRLPRQERAALMQLNDYLERNMPSIPLLSRVDFCTEEDGVHWTRDTARAMLKHWADFLNCKSP